MRIYEELYIARPDATEEEIDGLNGQLEHIIKDAGGGVDKVDKWGVRRLAYKVAKREDGYYVLVAFHAQPDTVREVERRLRVSDVVMKFITVRMDEKLKWLEKRKKAREKRAARRPAAPPPQATPAAPAAPAVPAESSPIPGAPEVETV
jgi:small subunit ribosomal protein S6